ncbi:MAG TPA: LysR family transcriptional regulator [Kofleriaceae bacterium]|jgi:DNA-binding transcriptional LysR family regulator
MHDVHGELAGIDLNLVLALDALLTERHVTRAAQRLGLTQSAASHALKRLRDMLDDPLLVRGPNAALVPTPLADRLAPQVRRILGELAGALRGETFDPATAKHTFHVGASDAVALVLLPPLVARLAKVAPNIDLWIHYAYTDWGDDELAGGKLDLVLGPPASRPAGAYEKLLFDDSFVCVMRKGHPLAKEKLTVSRYCLYGHVMVAPRGTPGSIVDSALEKFGRTRRIALAVPHFLTVPYCVAATDLIATLPTRVANVVADSVGLVRVPPPFDIPRFKISAAWHERRHHDATHRWLREQLLAVASEIR